MSDTQYTIPHCMAPCWPIECKNCPYGDENTTLEEVEVIMAAAEQQQGEVSEV